MPTPPSQPPRGRPGSGPGGGRRTCRRIPGPPLPDPDAVRLCPIPDSAPPYDDELLSPTARPAAPTSHTAAPAGEPDPGDGPAQNPGRLPPGDGSWPGQFAQVLVETLAGSRSPRQMTTWTTERTRARIQRLGPMLAAGQRPQLRRVVAFRPASGVIEMTVVVSFGPRVRALAVRLEHTPPPRALPGHQPRGPRWLCTDVEAA
ncbi:MAG: Rv3235 family protein [Streptosporangiaceae bacterium]